MTTEQTEEKMVLITPTVASRVVSEDGAAPPSDTMYPCSLREYATLKPPSVQTLTAVSNLMRDATQAFTPIGGQVNVGRRLDPSEPFEIDQPMLVPKADPTKNMMYSQIPLMVYDKPDQFDLLDPNGYGNVPNSDDIIRSVYNTEKNSEMVLAINADNFFTDVLIDQETSEVPNFLEELMYNNLSFVRRDWCETDTRFMQLLPYIVLYKRIRGEIHIFVYQRGKMGSEGRLAGGCSIGVGGHVNPHDFLKPLMEPRPTDTNFQAEVIGQVYLGDDARVVSEGFWTGIYNNIRRELGEEIIITRPGVNDDYAIDVVLRADKPEGMSMEEYLHSKTVFFSDYQAGAVEKAHLGMFMAFELTEDTEVHTREDILHDVGFRKLIDLYGGTDEPVIPSELECWSRSIVTSIGRTIVHKENTKIQGYRPGPTSTAMIAKGEHAVSINDVVTIPDYQKWSVGTLSQIFGSEYRYYAMNAFIRA